MAISSLEHHAPAVDVDAVPLTNLDRAEAKALFVFVECAFVASEEGVTNYRVNYCV